MKHDAVKSSGATSLLGPTLGALVIFATLTFGQATQPANLSLADSAYQAFGQGDYAKALPLLQELAGTLIDTPEKLGPVEEHIRACNKAIETELNLRAFTAPPSTPAINFAATRKPFPTPYPGATIDLSIWDLGNFDYNPLVGGNIPKDVMQLSGCTVRTRGYMFPTGQFKQICEFNLIPSFFDASDDLRQSQRFIVVELPKDTAISYLPDVVEVEGKLIVQDDYRYPFTAFEIDATSVKPAPQYLSSGTNSAH